MQPDPNIPPENPNAGSVPPVLPPPTARPSSSMRQLLAVLLSLYLGLFVIDAMVSLVDDSLILVFNLHLLSLIRGLVGVFALLLAIVVYGLMGLTPMIPKRLFLPLTLFIPAACLAAMPLTIYFFRRAQLIGWGLSLAEVIVGLMILRRVRGGFSFRWPLVTGDQLNERRFSWRNLSGFLLVNVFVLLPAVMVYLFFCIAVAVDHFSEGFMALHPGGMTVQVRTYVRDDGKTIRLFPMAHVAEADFYRKVARSFPTNSIILMEGVTDDKNLLTNKITYKRMAKTLGLAEQHETFEPGGEVVRADVDVEQFSPPTIDFLNLIMLIHAKGVNVETMLRLSQYSPPLNFQEQLFDDLLTKRNQHLLGEIHTRLSQSENLMVPWGVAHMPGIAREIQKSGFHLSESREYEVIRFHSADGKKAAEKPE